MTKLIAAYRASPSYLTAKAVRKYNDRHMMAACLLTPEDVAILNDAIEYANRVEAERGL